MRLIGGLVALARRYGHARAPAPEALSPSQLDALRRAAARRKAWSPRTLEIDGATLYALVSRGLVEEAAVLDGTTLYAATAAGRARAGA